MTIPSTRRRVFLGLTAGGLAALLAACGGGGTAIAPPEASTTVNRVTAVLSDYHIKLSTQTYHPGTYAFTVRNEGHHQHALELEGPNGRDRGSTLDPGQSMTLTVRLDSGVYQVFCPIDGHKDLGMKTEITVGGTPSGTTTPTTPPGNGY
ncbi:MULTISPECIES: copper-binding protein [unclassified Streptomyces]|uniref:copper-binding protein n=1 Tax=unclassified Streptomyces TaxID=2593676 RepID=UPI0016613668|nr:MULTISPECIES: copper-binding protein [unclassified Streptomyces]MBD0709581.1 hypothetical protein [Streptomyces sp. CBMA291]MBD0714393.1 hypothetical protein [Streptomyces sp. CBMA370]